MARVLVACSGIPHPTVGASTVLFHHYIDALLTAGHEVLSVLLLDAGHNEHALLEEYRRFAAGTGRMQVVTCESRRYITEFLDARTRMPTLSFDRAAADPARPAIEAFAPDVALYLDLLPSWAGRGWPVPRALTWLGDLNFQTRWYHALYSVMEGVLNPVGVDQVVDLCDTWRQAYKTLLASVDTVVVASHSSVEQLGKLGVKATYLPYPWPVKERVPQGVVKPAHPSLLFFGTFSGALGSRSAMHFLLERVYPLLVREFGRGGFEIRICGRFELLPWVREAIAVRPEIKVLGFVPDLGEVMGASHAMLAPIDVPVGNRSRILTCLANRLPVIAHPNTALGNPCLVDGQTCLLADDPAVFVEKIKLICGSPDLAAAIAERGYAAYNENFAPPVAGQKLLDCIDALLARPH